MSRLELQLIREARELIKRLTETECRFVDIERRLQAIEEGLRKQ